jgi:hypothetical protein
MLDIQKYKELVPPELAIAIPAGGVFGAVYTGAKQSMSDDPNPTAEDIAKEVTANSIASGAATGTGLLLNKYLT